MGLDLRRAKEKREQRTREMERVRRFNNRWPENNDDVDFRRGQEKWERDQSEEKERARRKREREKYFDEEIAKGIEKHSKLAKAAIERKYKWATERASLEPDVRRSERLISPAKEKPEAAAGTVMAMANSTLLRGPAIDKRRFKKKIHNFVSSPVRWERNLDTLASEELVGDEDESSPNEKHFKVEQIPDNIILKGSEQEQKRKSRTAKYATAFGHTPVMDLMAVGEVRRTKLEFILEGLERSVTGLRAVNPTDYLADMVSAWCETRATLGRIELISRYGFHNGSKLWLMASRLARPTDARSSREAIPTSSSSSRLITCSALQSEEKLKTGWLSRLSNSGMGPIYRVMGMWY
ncbi:unnamed protein product [Calypogeia fissa]